MGGQSLSVEFLGGFRCRSASGEEIGIHSRKAQALLALLALHPRHLESRERLAALLWPDTPAVQARQSLRQTLAGLRRDLGRAGRCVLLIHLDSLGLDPGRVTTDVSRFERLLARRGDAALREAVSVYQGDLLEGLSPNDTFEDWVRPQRERLRGLAIEALHEALARDVEARCLESGIQTALRLLGIEPHDEVAHRALMRIFCVQGRPGAAARQYRICVETLDRELGVTPAPETTALYRKLVEARAPPPPASPASARPSRARLPCQANHPPLIGREAEMSRLGVLRRGAWRGQGATAVLVGEAGAGKTRLVQESVAEARRHRGRVLIGQSYESERVLPFGVWAGAIREGAVLAWSWPASFPSSDRPTRSSPPVPKGTSACSRPSVTCCCSWRWPGHWLSCWRISSGPTT